MIKVCSVLIIVNCAWTGVLGQIGEGTGFNILNADSTQKSIGYIANLGSGNCKCEIDGSCVSNGLVGILRSPRVVHITASPTPDPSVCPNGYLMCCKDQQNPSDDNICGHAPTTNISPDNKKTFSYYPWQVAIFDNQQNLLVSGVLIDKQHVLTTAHKVDYYVDFPEKLFVQVGEWRVGESSRKFPQVRTGAVNITIHPDFDPSDLDNDVAVIKLINKVPLETHPNVNIICKPKSVPPIGTRCHMSRWDENSFRLSESSVKGLDVPIIDSDECENRLKLTDLGADFKLDKKSFICAGGEPENDNCEGNSGSPLVCMGNYGQWEVVGLVAQSFQCNDDNPPGLPGVYVNVYNYLNWINNVLHGT